MTMPENKAQVYITGVADQLDAAVRNSDYVGVDTILDDVDNDGYPAAAAILRTAVYKTSLFTQTEE